MFYLLSLNIMCTRPIRISNPSKSRSTYASEFGAIVDVPRHLVPGTDFIEVPCGKCAECRNSYFNSLLQRAIVESMTSYMYFITLTYDNEHLPVLSLPGKDDIYYADYADIQRLFKRLRRHNILDRDFRYLVACEYGDTYSRPHFHILLFVGKKTTDSLDTPYFIRKTLFDNIAPLYARNVGSFKKPIYERLFTYSRRVTRKGIKTNYFVEYVEPSQNIEFYRGWPVQDDNFIKTIRYLIGYVNKGSSFDDIISSYLESIPDVVLVAKLRYLLRSRVRYSKGFGCGFDLRNGTKVYLPKISVRASSQSLVYTEFVDSLPSTFSDFCDSYPDMLEDLKDFISCSKYADYNSLSDALFNFSTTDYLCHCVILKYFNIWFSRLYKILYQKTVWDTPSVGGYFDFIHRNYSYHKAKVYSHDFEHSFVYNYLRKNVEDSVRLGLPYFGFRIDSQQRYTSLCRFYKERICTIQDYIDLYRRLGVSSYDEWQKLFTKEKLTYQANKAHAHKLTHENDDKICNNQKRYLYLPRRLEGINIYIDLFS